jgi:hypothetical protein
MAKLLSMGPNFKQTHYQGVRLTLAEVGRIAPSLLGVVVVSAHALPIGAKRGSRQAAAAEKIVETQRERDVWADRRGAIGVSTVKAWSLVRRGGPSERA